MTETSGTWTLDPAASSVTFSAKAMWGLATVKGTFGILSGEGTVAEDGSATGKVAVDAGSVNTRNSSRGPLLLISGKQDHTVPDVVTRSTFKQYRHSTAVTDLEQIHNRGHSLTIDSGWRDVANIALNWLKTRGL